MKKNKIEYLAPYLPYDLNVKIKFAPNTSLPWYYEDKEIFILEGMMLDWYQPGDIKSIKPFLRPLNDFSDSDADTEIFNIGQYYTSVKLNAPKDLPQWEFQILLKHHFDVFDLISQGLAIDIKKLNL